MQKNPVHPFTMPRHTGTVFDDTCKNWTYPLFCYGEIPDGMLGGVSWFGNDDLVFELAFDLSDKGRRNSKRAPAQNGPEFGKIYFAR